MWHSSSHNPLRDAAIVFTDYHIYWASLFSLFPNEQKLYLKTNKQTKKPHPNILVIPSGFPQTQTPINKLERKYILTLVHNSC